MKTVKASLDANLSDRELKRAIQDVIESDEQVEELIDADAPLSGGPLGRSSLIFEEHSEWRLLVGRSNAPGEAASWRILARKVPAGSWRSPLKALQPPPLVPGASGSHARLAGDSLTRREHASVEVRSAGGTRIIFDPIFRSLLQGYAFAMPAPEPGIAAAFVTHSHADHFDLPSLDYLAAGGATVYVPQVHRNSILSEDMHHVLARCGLDSRTCDPGSLIEIGDITVEALPFYGEQPSVLVSPADAGIRNWGCCYRIDTSGFSALLLADSGTDPSGNMLTAISDSVSRRGPIDVVLGCLRHLMLPFEVDGLPCYYIVLPMAGLRSDRELFRRGRLPSATLGPSGTAAACAEAGAKIFLPYAHGLTGFGQPIEDNPFGPGPGVDERSACGAMADELRKIGCDTTVLSWNPGERWTPAF